LTIIKCYNSSIKKILKICNSIIDTIYSNDLNQVILIHYDYSAPSYHIPKNNNLITLKKEIRNTIYQHYFINDRHNPHQPVKKIEIIDYDEWINECNELYINSQYF